MKSETKSVNNSLWRMPFMMRPRIGLMFLCVICLVSTGAFFSAPCVAGESRNMEKLERNVANLRKQLANFRSVIENFRVEIRELKGLVEKNHYTLGKTVGRTKRVSAVNRRELNLIKDDIGIIIQKLEHMVRHPGTDSAPEKDAAPEAAGNDQAKDAYDGAKALFDKGDYAGALTAFENFLKRFPGTDLADNAIFWTGETYSMQNRHEEAILEYQKVIENHPDGNKVPAALLRQGAAFDNLGDKTSAGLVFRELINEFPDSTEAGLAKKKLETASQ